MSKFYKCLEYISFSDIVVAFFSFHSLAFSLQWYSIATFFQVPFHLLYCFTLNALGTCSIRPLTPWSLWKSKYHCLDVNYLLPLLKFQISPLWSHILSIWCFCFFDDFLISLTDFFDDNKIKHGAQRHC